MNHVSNSDAAWIAFAGLFPVVLYLIYSGYQTKQRMAVRRAVIDKFTSAQDFAAFLQSPGGQKFIADLSGSESPARTIMAAVQRGIVLGLLGGGVWWAGIKIQETAELATLGVLLVCIGAGILISAGISYRLSKSWGLIAERAGEDRTGSVGK